VIAWLPYPIVEDDISQGRLVLAGTDSWNIDMEILIYRAPGIGNVKVEQLWHAANKLPQL